MADAEAEEGTLVAVERLLRDRAAAGGPDVQALALPDGGGRLPGVADAEAEEGTLVAVERLLRDRAAAGGPDVQALALPKRSAAEEALAKHSELGRALIGALAKGIEALPFGAPVAAVIGVVYARAAQVTGRGVGLMHV